MNIKLAGNPTDMVEYSPYGTTTYRYGTNNTPFLYNGQFGVQTDPNGLLYMRARYYNQYISRFINADPSGFGGGLNFYAFCNDNPISEANPFGLAGYGNPVSGPNGPVGPSSPFAPGMPYYPNGVFYVPGVFPSTSSGSAQVVQGTLTVVGGLGSMLGGAAISETGAGAVLGVPAMFTGATSFGLGITTIANGLSGGPPVSTPNGNIPQGTLELIGAASGNPNLQNFGSLGDTAVSFILPPKWGGPVSLLNTAMNPPQFNQSTSPSASPTGK